MRTYIAYLPRYGNFLCKLKFDEVARRDDTDVVQVQAENLEHVFALLNHGSGQELDGYMGRSLSVGDFVVDSTGRAWLCDSFGWVKAS